MRLNEPKLKILRYPERLAEYKLQGKSFPINAELDLTNKCSLKCKGCMSAHMRNVDELSAEEIYSIIAQLKRTGCKSITFTGGGDPLESPNWQYAMTLAMEAGMKMGLYSYLPSITQNKVDFISAHCEFVYGHNTPTTVHRPEGTKCKWVCNWLLDSTNWTKINDFLQKTNWNLFEKADFRPLITEGDNYEWCKPAVVLLRGIQREDVTWADYKFYDLLDGKGERCYGACHSTDFSCSIGADGTMWECVNRRGITPIGNILTDGIEKVWETKPRGRTDFTGCRILCRNHELNKTLWEVFGPEPKNVEFV